MPSTRREFISSAMLSAAGLGTLDWPALARVAAGRTKPADLGLSLETAPQSGKPFRMTEPWYRTQVARVQQALTQRGLTGILLRDSNNLNYLTGLFLTNTERPVGLWVPARGELAIFGPGLDKDMYAEWWIKDAEWYFDYPHAGAFNQVVLAKGATVDLSDWIWRGIARRGGGEGKVGVEAELTPSANRRLRAALPKAIAVDAGDILLQMRMRKTPEEIALTQVAIDYHDQMLRFARDLIAEKGVGMYDSQVRRASEEYGEGLVFSELKLNARAHVGVGCSVGISQVRAGVATAYPHPNQYFRKRIEKGDAVQIASVVKVGGYGGEGYRALHLEPIPALGRRMWEVHTAMCEAQVAHSKPGVECRAVAEQVLAVARKEGMLAYVAHRPAHGQGMEGHQPPYISLGDGTVLADGMMFSNEPGLYHVAGGFGYNHSNCVLITATGARLMNQVPMTKEFCWI
jgi:Xaa-Pro aminopeptidase